MLVVLGMSTYPFQEKMALFGTLAKWCLWIWEPEGKRCSFKWWTKFCHELAKGGFSIFVGPENFDQASRIVSIRDWLLADGPCSVEETANTFLWFFVRNHLADSASLRRMRFSSCWFFEQCFLCTAMSRCFSTKFQRVLRGQHWLVARRFVGIHCGIL